MKAHQSTLLRCKTIGRGGESKLLAAAKHNLREITGPHIDATRTPSNVVLQGPCKAHEVVALAARKRAAAGVKLARKDATLAGEVIFGLPTSTTVDTDAYFRASLAWLVSAFGEDSVLSAVIHYDETPAHLHVLMQPTRGGMWLGSGVFGKVAALKVLQTSYARTVGAPFGVRQAPERLSGDDRARAAGSVLKCLKEAEDPVFGSQVWSVVRDLIEADPRAFSEVLGIQIQRKLRTLAELKVSRGRGPARERATSIALDGSKEADAYALLELTDSTTATERGKAAPQPADQVNASVVNAPVNAETETRGGALETGLETTRAGFAAPTREGTHHEYAANSAAQPGHENRCENPHSARRLVEMQVGSQDGLHPKFVPLTLGEASTADASDQGAGRLPLPVSTVVSTETSLSAASDGPGAAVSRLHAAGMPKPTREPGSVRGSGRRPGGTPAWRIVPGETVPAASSRSVPVARTALALPTLRERWAAMAARVRAPPSLCKTGAM